MAVLIWSIKSSLIGYIRGMEDGQVRLTDVTETPEGFVFPESRTADSAIPAAVGVRSFGGVVTLAGHRGMLFLPFAEPRVYPIARGWELSITDDEEEKGWQGEPGRLVFATIDEFREAPGGALVARGTRLTADGAELFFGPYEKGTELDDPIIRGAD